MAQRETQRSIRTGPLGREVSQQETFREAPRPYPQAEPVRTPGIVVQEGNDLAQLAKGLQGLSGGIDSFMRLQATYGQINMQEQRLRGQLGLPKGHGLGLQWGVDKGHAEGVGISKGKQIANRVTLRLESEGALDNWTKDDIDANMNKIIDEETTNILGTNVSADVMAGAAAEIAEAKLAGEVYATRYIWAKERERKLKDVMDFADSSRDNIMVSIASVLDNNPNAKPDHVYYRSLLARATNDMATKFGISRDQTNSLVLQSLSDKVLELGDKGDNNALVMAGHLINIAKSKDADGYSYMKAVTTDAKGNVIRPYANSIRQLENQLDNLTERAKARIEKQLADDENLAMSEIMLGLSNKEITINEAIKQVQAHPLVRPESKGKLVVSLTQAYEEGQFNLENTGDAAKMMAGIYSGKYSINDVLASADKWDSNTLDRLTNAAISVSERNMARAESRANRASAERVAQLQLADKENELRVKRILASAKTLIPNVVRGDPDLVKAMPPDIYDQMLVDIEDFARKNPKLTPDLLHELFSNPPADPNLDPIFNRELVNHLESIKMISPRTKTRLNAVRDTSFANAK